MWLFVATPLKKVFAGCQLDCCKDGGNFPDCLELRLFLSEPERTFGCSHYAAPQTFKALHDWINSKFDVSAANTTCPISSNITTASTTTTTPS